MIDAMLIDTHCHLNFDAYDADRDELLARAVANGVTYFINPSVDLDSGLAAQRLAAQYPNVFAAAGIHPTSTADFSDSHLEQIEHQARSSPKVVAIGEIGLDYHWDDSPKPVQRAAFEAQLILAARLKLPVIIHNREASDDVIAVLRDWVATLPADQKARPGVARARIRHQHGVVGKYFEAPSRLVGSEQIFRDRFDSVNHGSSAFVCCKTTFFRVFAMFPPASTRK